MVNLHKSCLIDTAVERITNNWRH